MATLIRQLPPHRWQTLGRILVLGIGLILAMAFYFGALNTSWLEPLAELTAQATAVGLSVIGIATNLDGTILSSEDFAVNVVTECLSIGPILVYLAVVLAYPSDIKAKAWGAIAGVLILTVINLARIISLFWIGSYYPDLLTLAHLIVWQTAMILIALILGLFWVDRVAHARHV